MSSLHSTSKKSYRANAKSKRSAEEATLYGKISLMLLAKNGYELSKQDNSEFCKFAIGRDVNIGKDRKLDDVVFSYADQISTNNLIFVQVKHKEDYDKVDSQVLNRAKDVEDLDGGMCRDFNLQKCFISYLSIRNGMKNPKSKELLNGKIKYVVLFTNISLDNEELNKSGFRLKEAPDDFINLFTLEKSLSKTQQASRCYQFENVPIGLRKILENSSDLLRLAKELAQYAVCEEYRENRIMGIEESPMNHYHFGLGKEVIEKSDQIKNVSTGKQTENELYCEAQFRRDFLDSDKTASNLNQLRNALFEAVREHDESKKDANDNELKRVLKEAKWKVVTNFGGNEQNIKTDLPCEWVPIKDEDIADFLQCFVFIVEQPRIRELEKIYKSSIKDTVVENTSLKHFLDQIYDTGPEIRNCIEKVLGIDSDKTNTKEKWISGDEIKSFIDEKKQLVSVTFVVTAMTLMYKNEVLQYGKFTEMGKIIDDVDSFLTSNCRILCVNTPVTLLSSIKILQHLNTGKDYNAENDRIFVNLGILNCSENRNSVLKAFELETNNLLTVECRHVFKDQDVEQFFFELLNLTKNHSDKKLILIIQPKNCDIFTENIKTYFQDETLYVLKHDSIDLRDFKPIADPLVKDVLVFQGQKEKISLFDLTGIDSWSSYVNNLSVETSGHGIIDGITLLEILSNNAIEVGSMPPGTSSLDGAYAKIYEEINVQTLAKKCVSLEHTNDTKDIYIISGICRSSKQEKAEKIIQCLGLSENKEKIQEQVGDIGSDKTMQISDDQFQDEDFRSLCHNSPDKRIFWICVKWENNATKFMLQEIYNPQFYLKRKFKDVIIKKDLKKHLLKEYLSEIFIFHCVEGKRELYKFLELNEHETKQFEGNCKIKIFSLKSDAEGDFKILSKKNETVHLLEFEENQLSWWDSHGSLCKLRMYIDHKQSKRSLVEEDKLIRKIKDRKVVVLADDPGMGKSTTVIKLYETERESSSSKNSQWVIVIKLTKCLKAIRDIELRKDSIDIVSVLEFLSKIDSKLHITLAKKLLAIALDKSKYFSNILLLVFDGFDEILDDDDRKRIIMLLQFIKNETAARLWITTRLHQKESLEKELSTIAIAFVPMDSPQKIEYITMYLQHRLYLILKEEKYTELFDNNDKVQDNECKYSDLFDNNDKVQDNEGKYSDLFDNNDKVQDNEVKYSDLFDNNDKVQDNEGKYNDLFDNNDKVQDNEGEYSDFFDNNDKVQDNGVIHVYTVAFLNKMESIFSGDLARFIGTPLQLYLMLEESVGHFKIWIEDDKAKIPDFNYVGNDIEEVYEKFIDKKYCVYFQKIGIREHIQKRQESINLNQYYKECAKSRILEIKPKESLYKFLDRILLAGIIKSEDSELQFIHKTFEEFFAAKVFFHWIEKKPNIFSNTNKQEYLLKVILLKSGYQLARTFINIQLQKMTEQARTEEIDEILKHYGTILSKILADFKRPLIDENGTPLHVAVKEGNNAIASFLVKSLKDEPYVLEDFLFNDEETDENTALQLACMGDDVEIVQILLDAVNEISEDTLQRFLKFGRRNNAFQIAAKRRFSSNTVHTVQIYDELLRRANSKLDLLLTPKSALCTECGFLGDKEYLEFLLQEFKHDKHSLKQLLLYNDEYGNALCYAKTSTTIEKMISAAKSVNDNNETVKKLLLPEKGKLPLHVAVSDGETGVVEKLLNVAKEIDDDNRTLQQLLLDERYGISPLDIALLTFRGPRGVIKLLLKTAADLSIDLMEKLIIAADTKNKNAVQLVIELRNANILADIFKILEEYKYQSIRKKILEMFDNVPLESRLYLIMEKLITAIEHDDIKNVKYILTKAKNFSGRPDESLRILLLTEDVEGNSTLWIACKRRNSKIIAELLSCAMSIDDGGAILKTLLVKRNFLTRTTPFRILKDEAKLNTSEIKQIVESLISEAKKINNEQVVNIFQEINSTKCDYLQVNSDESDDVSEELDSEDLDPSFTNDEISGI